MSGIFKNFDRLVCASNFNKVNHKFMVKSPLFNFQPAWLYYTPGQQLTRGHGHDVFELSQISYQLVKQVAKQQQWLQNISEENNASVYQEIKQKSQASQSFIQDAVQEIALQFKSGVAESNSIETLTNYVYVLAQQPKNSKNTEIYNTYLQPQILSKIQYASQQNLSDLVQGLVGLGIYNEDIWNATLSAFRSKTLSGQYENVDFHAWELDQYEYSQKQRSQCQGSEEQFFNEIAAGNTGPLTQVKRCVYGLFEQVFLRALNPFFFRENRPASIMYSVDFESEKENTVAALKQAAEQIPEAADVASYISSRY
ncbi:hypothetical protein PPERSA_10190 [Pseudocohnilembus persalinus]|uniref:Uncharacterized protein n=1 Tax=Pseudocohnilembus persalinus TaxID=266149 RepID=A0A0V0QMB7_PSEPJ|nr:hypothetical protein PPERSA_10190 [Pseudocohnilembus persalinus]|eukprot:KRX03109.1 hypothetical protein PPERSA_10190 [Pseudocohnilembus persalinus]